MPKQELAQAEIRIGPPNKPRFLVQVGPSLEHPGKYKATYGDPKNANIPGVDPFSPENREDIFDGFTVEDIGQFFINLIQRYEREQKYGTGPTQPE